MDFKKAKRFLYILLLSYLLLSLMVYLVAYEQFRYTEVEGDEMLSPAADVGEIVDGVEITQRIFIETDQFTGLDLYTTTYGRENTGELILTLTDENNSVVAQVSIDVSTLPNGAYFSVLLDEPIDGYRGRALTMTLSANGCTTGNAVSVCYGKAVSTGRVDVEQNISEEDLFAINGEKGEGKICIRTKGINFLTFYKIYWVIIAVGFVVIVVSGTVMWKQTKKGKNNIVAMICIIYCKYSFLLKQLISRDFKIKYKRSALGVAWSFLNPLLSMAVQYVVFSTIFRSDVPNYPLYLLTGIVFFNFFSEATSTGMVSITSNAALIKKVYMPKYIYPISKVFSSLINFSLAILPIFLFMIFTGTPFRPSLLLLIFDIICLTGFIAGMVMLLSTSMTFFQDTQFLWSVISMAWMYLTPIFWPETIVPAELLPYFRMNPMYQYIDFARTCIINGVSPEPMAYIKCAGIALISMIIGITVFRKNQNKFVMHL